VLNGRGKFEKRYVVEGGLEISTARVPDDERLRVWIDESRAVLPRLSAIVRNGAPSPAPLELVVEDLRRRVEELEQELARLRR
jgi:hypothetical protein